MKLRFNRYAPDMLRILSQQSYTSLALNALVRGLLFSVLIQLISLASGLGTNGLVQVLLLTLIFGFMIFSIDLFEKSWAQYTLRKHR